MVNCKRSIEYRGRGIDEAGNHWGGVGSNAQMELPEELWQRVLYPLPVRTLLRAGNQMNYFVMKISAHTVVVPSVEGATTK
eukprot:7115786-Pyramimonas_sp.AAC.5